MIGSLANFKTNHNTMSSNKKLIYGYHASIDRGYLAAVERPISFGAGAVQLWMGNSKGYASKTLEPKVYQPVKEYVTKNKLRLIAHSPYLLNFARPLQDTPAGMKALERYLRDLVNVTNLGGLGSVLHMGANVKELNQSYEKACENFADNLRWIIARMPETATIILENMAGGGTRMCCEMDPWIEFWSNYIDDDMRSRIKWCIDTAHLYATGEYDLSKETEVQRFYDDFDQGIGWEHVMCIHFNGSKSALGSHHDNHADIGPKMSGLIETKGLLKLAQIAAETDKFMILETPCEEHNLLEQFAVIKGKGAALL